MVAYRPFLVNEWALSLSRIAPSGYPPECAHIASCDGLEPIWRFANSSGVK